MLHCCTSLWVEMIFIVDGGYHGEGGFYEILIESLVSHSCKSVISLGVETFLGEFDCLCATKQSLHSLILVEGACKFKRTNFGVQQIMSWMWFTNIRCEGRGFDI